MVNASFAQARRMHILPDMCKSLNSLTIVFALACSLWFVSPARAWIDSGHKIVSMVAWEELTPKTKAAVLEILKAHPRYEKDLLANAPKDASEDEMGRHLFASAAVWPDLVRLQSHPMRAAYNHPDWHYIDIPFVLDNQRLPTTHPSTQPGPRNIVEALHKVTGDIADAKVSAADKAIAMCWIVHLVGDIHEPLHAATLFSHQFPKGDQGGNLALVLRDPPYADSQMKLHLLWDELPGNYKSEDLDGYVATGLRTDKRYSRDALKDQLSVTDFAAWADESHALAVKYAYLDGNLKTAVAPPPPRDDQSPSTRPAAPPKELLGSHAKVPGVPPGYLAQSEEVAERQVVLAGYRLADLLNNAFDPK
jgi:hypothetical protein